MKLPIADLHCDLLLYLSLNESRKADQPEARCSYSQLKEGLVFLQTFAIFSETKKNSVLSGEKQLSIFQTLPFQGFKLLTSLRLPDNRNEIHAVAAIENASSLCEEDEDFSHIFRRLDHVLALCGPLLYISLTWNSENRFGGGNSTSIGLKRDGEELLDYIDGKKIAIDLSHTSDALANDILNYIDKKSLCITPIASHSNFRKIWDHPRNLPDSIAREIIHRGGVIGLNFVKKFIGDSAADLRKHIEHAVKLGGLHQLCFGADFFCDHDVSASSLQPFFFEELGDSSCYGSLLSELSTDINPKNLEGIAYQNLSEFFKRQLCI
jgi:membrane dipeptidase